MEFVDDISRKTGQASLLAVEAAKASRALEIGKDTGLFSVPKVVNFDAEAGVLEFERLGGLVTLLDLAVRTDRRLPELLEKAGRALAVIHAELTLPEEMKHELPAEWMNSRDDNVFIHGDFACINVCFHEPSDELVILDFSAAPMVGRTATFGTRYFDILLFVSSLFHGAPYRSVLSWDAGKMAGTFLRGYAKAAPGETEQAEGPLVEDMPIAATEHMASLKTETAAESRRLHLVPDADACAFLSILAQVRTIITGVPHV